MYSLHRSRPALDTSSAAAVIGTVSEAGPALRGGRTRQAEAGWRGDPPSWPVLDGQDPAARPHPRRYRPAARPTGESGRANRLLRHLHAPRRGRDAAWPALVLMADHDGETIEWWIER